MAVVKRLIFLLSLATLSREEVVVVGEEILRLVLQPCNLCNELCLKYEDLYNI